MPMVIGIDHGFYAIKGAHVVFPSGLTAYDYEPYTMQNVLQYGEKYYVCGTERQALLKDKTVNDNYYLLTMAALAQELRYRNADKRMEIILAAGLPLAGFGREKQAFQKYFLRKERPLGFQYEGEEYRIWIRDVKLFPQGYSAIALHPEYVKDEPSVLLADIGGWTVDLMRLDNAVPNAATCRSLELGVIRCMDEAMEQIRRRTGLSVTDIQIERVLNGSGCSMDETAKEMIHRQGRIYTERILSSIMEAGFDFKAVPVIFMGGGASIIERHVEPQDGLCRAIFLTDVHANAAGYERIAVQMLEQ
jgi:plasmid segregation protein ParM